MEEVISQEENGGKKTRSERGRRTRRKHTRKKGRHMKKKAVVVEALENEVSSVTTTETLAHRSESEEEIEEEKKLRAEAVAFVPCLPTPTSFLRGQQTQKTPVGGGTGLGKEDHDYVAFPNIQQYYYTQNRTVSVDSLTEEELTLVASTIGDDDFQYTELSEYITTPENAQLEGMRSELVSRQQIEDVQLCLAKEYGDWAGWAVAAAEAERCRRLVALAELEEEARHERVRRQAWAVEAVAIEKRRQMGLDLLSTASNSRWWLEEVLGQRQDAYDDYELVCPYACFGCKHVCRRSRLSDHLARCCSAEGGFTGITTTKNTTNMTANDAIQDDESAQYLVVCPNAVMGCRVVCHRGNELQRHLDICPFSDCTRQVERAQREQLRAIVASQAEQERARRVDADFRATLASAAARAARRGFHGRHSQDDLGLEISDNTNGDDEDCYHASFLPKNKKESRRTKQAAVIKRQQKAAIFALGTQLRTWWKAESMRCETGRQRRRQAIENVRSVVIQAFEDMTSRLLGRGSKSFCAPITVNLFGSCAYGLDSEHSDLDLVVTGWDQACTAVRGNATWVLHRLAQQLRGHANIKVLKIIDRARVPVIKARVIVIPDVTENITTETALHDVSVDLSLATPSHTGLEAAGLCRSLLRAIPALAPAALALKKLLAQHQLNDPFTGGLPSYAVVLMLFYSRLHSKHAETHLQSRRGRPFERSATLSDDSWRINAFGKILKKTQQRNETSSSISDQEIHHEPDQATSAPNLVHNTPQRDILNTPNLIYASPRRATMSAHRAYGTTLPSWLHEVSPEARGEALGLELLSKGGFLSSSSKQEQQKKQQHQNKDNDKDIVVDDIELAETLLEALSLFGCDFAPQKEGFSVRHGGRRLVIDDGRRLVIAPHLRAAQSKARRLKLDHNILIEDPLDPTNNVGRASYHVYRALDLFKSHYDKLRAAMSKFDPTQLTDNTPSAAPLPGAGKPLLSTDYSIESLRLPDIDDSLSKKMTSSSAHRPLLDAFFGHQQQQHCRSDSLDARIIQAATTSLKTKSISSPPAQTRNLSSSASFVEPADNNAPSCPTTTSTSPGPC